MEAAVGNSFLGTGLLQAAELLLLLLQAAELRPSSLLLLLLLLLLAISPPAAAAAVSGLTLSRAAPRLLAAPAASSQQGAQGAQTATPSSFVQLGQLFMCCRLLKSAQSCLEELERNITLAAVDQL